MKLNTGSLLCLWTFNVASAHSVLQSNTDSLPMTSYGDSIMLRGQRQLQPSTRIVGGSPASSNEFPSFANLSGCGGALIWEDIVVTAAHCGSFVGETIHIGGNQVSGADSTDSLQISAERAHPDYDGDKPDIMLLKLNRPSSAPVSPWSTRRPDDGEKVTSIGYGATTEGGNGSNVLLEVKLSIVNFSQCNEAYTNDGYDPLNTQTMICAGAPGKDSCQGDSGGPLYSSSGDVVGIVSFGEGCARAAFPGVYARVDTMKSFIEQGICELSSNPPSTCRDIPPTSPAATPVATPVAAPFTAPVAAPVAAPAPMPSDGDVSDIADDDYSDGGEEDFVEDDDSFDDGNADFYEEDDDASFSDDDVVFEDIDSIAASDDDDIARNDDGSVSFWDFIFSLCLL